eukprot:CAMPEP_0182865310 /NCGR_PEP_ID=MMETSP0034_2-20130328/7624_1 /TAXON_ID=156128 /ORGANISM="Nephroselmis pyriformis, Strain CCMP717" /LENGTH=235 /DNA_ID=CAMNT_0024997605 /DNA_START=311 /DNA_END=1018 /DNA_ORIENTATION=-
MASSGYVPPTMDPMEAGSESEPFLRQEEEIPSPKEAEGALDAPSVQAAAVPTVFAPGPPQAGAMFPAAGAGMPAGAAPAGATSFMHIPDLPDAVDSFNNMGKEMKVYMFTSIIAILMSVFIGLFIFALLGGIIGTIAASMHQCKCCRVGPSVSGSVVAIRALAITQAVFSGLTTTVGSILLLSFPCEGDCFGFTVWIVFMVIFYASHTVQGINVAKKAGHVKKLLSPVTAGMVVL